MSQRHDFYGPVHKGLRLGAARLLARIGALDTDDSAAIGLLIADLRGFLDLARAHLKHEDREVNGLLHRCSPDLARQIGHDHAEHEATFAALSALIAELETGMVVGRTTALRALYLRFSAYVADDLQHMAREETVALPMLQAQFSDVELAAAEARIVAAMPPDTMVGFLRLILPAATPQDRIAFLRDVHAGAPPEAFRAILDQAARPSLAAADWERLRDAFALAA
jgi:hemerythrin-like domain-containing protein